jgi:hypothetical protein
VTVTTRGDPVASIAARIGEPLSLGVARIDVDGRVAGSKLVLGDDAAEAFREQCRSVLDAISAGTAVPYSGGAELADDQFFVIDDRETLAELTAVAELRDSIETLPLIRPADLDLTVQLYAVAAGADDRVLFVRRANPRIPFGSGRFLAIGRERLTRVGPPVFSFSARFDFVIGDGWVVVVDQPGFERVLRQVGLVEQNVCGWIDGITRHLPMPGDDVDKLRKVAMQDSRTWRRLREIEHRGHLAGVSLEQVRAYAASVGLDPDTVVAGDGLRFDPAQRFSFLHLLNEDLYKGQLTEKLFEAQRKVPAR